MTPLGTLAWTASSAGWFVLAYLTRLPEAAYTAIGCAVMAYIWHQLQKLGGQTQDQGTGEEDR